MADLPPELQVRVQEARGARILLRSEAPLAHLALLAAWARRVGADVRDLVVSRPSLEQVYLELTGSERP